MSFEQVPDGFPSPVSSVLARCESMTMHEPPPDRTGLALLAADRLLRPIEFATVIIAGAAIFFVMWIGVAEIFSRKLFNYPTLRTAGHN